MVVTAPSSAAAPLLENPRPAAKTTAIIATDFTLAFILTNRVWLS